MTDVISPIPFLDKSGNGHDGLLYAAPGYCRNCPEKKCLSFLNNNNLHDINRCYKNLYFVVFSFEEVEYVWNGILIKGRAYPKDFKIMKKVGIIEMNEFSLNLLIKNYKYGNFVENFLYKYKRKSQSQSLHDIKPLVGALTSVVERSDVERAQKAKAYSDDDVAILKDVVFDVYQILGAIKNQIDLSDFIIAPEALESVGRRKMKIHGLWYKNGEIYNTIAKKTRNLEIEVGKYPFSLNGEMELPEAFTLLPSILLDNAIKYSTKDNKIYVKFSENNGKIEISVSSFGAVVPLDKRDIIWTSGGRVKHDSLAGRPGSGYGLYLAKKICDISNFNIHYLANGEFSDKNGVTFGWNEFTLSQL